MSRDEQDSNGKSESLTFLADRELQDWPEPWRAASEAELTSYTADGSLDIPDAVDASILKKIRSSAQESGPEPVQMPRQGRARFLLAAAATLLIALGAGLYVLLPRGDRGLTIVNSNVPALRGSQFAHGALVTLAADQTVVVYPNGSYLVQLSGPGRFGLHRPNASLVRIQVHAGSVLLRSTASAEPKPTLKLRTSMADYQVVGTIARLVVSGRSQSLQVLKGRIRARARGKTEGLTVTAGQQMQLDAGSGSDVSLTASPMGAKVRAQLARAARELRAPSKGKLNSAQSPEATPRKSPTAKTAKKPRPRPARKKVTTLKALRSQYGSLQLVKLKNGRRIVGHMRFQGKHVLIYTVYGPVRIPRSQFGSAQER